MFICNMKFNSKKIWKTAVIIFIILVIIIIVCAIFKLYSAARLIDQNKEADSSNSGKVIELNSDNYTNFLRESHENIDSYLNVKVKGVGYIYKMPDFTDKQFVLARTMVLNETNQGVVVGMLCECEQAPNFKPGDWVYIEGCIIKGNYKGEMPVINVTTMLAAEAPDNEFVNQPTD